jgi:hypothetical protein
MTDSGDTLIHRVQLASPLLPMQLLEPPRFHFSIDHRQVAVLGDSPARSANALVNSA